MLRWTRARRARIALPLLVGLAGALLPAMGPAAAAGPTVVVTPPGAVSWGDTLTVTTSGYPVQEAAYIALCDPGTIGKVLTVQADFGVGPACAGELEHRGDPGFNPNTNYGFINGANGSDTVVLTDGLPSSSHCSTGTCDLVVFDHNCIDFPPGTHCTFLGQPLTFLSAIPHVTIKGNGATLKYAPSKIRIHWSGAVAIPQCTDALSAITFTNSSKQSIHSTGNSNPFVIQLLPGESTGFCLWGTGKATFQFGLQGSAHVLTVKVS